MIPAFEQEKTVHAVDRADNVTGKNFTFFTFRELVSWFLL
jgi:hypothetical protein